jgi:hypothetical protein
MAVLLLIEEVHARVPSILVLMLGRSRIALRDDGLLLLFLEVV